MENMASVTLKNIIKRYEGASEDTVKGFNLEIADKEFIVFVGASGCGKSTTLRMIAGLEEITEGELYIDERLVNDVAPKDRDIAMVFQSYALYPHMSVYQNMAFGLKLRKFNKADIDQKVREAAKILDIVHLLERKPKALSGGQRQRVALGRAIVRDPKVFLMDEPLSNLDAKLRVQMRSEINKLHKRLQTTVIYVTHDQTEAMTMGDRIVVMDKGIIQQAASPEEIYNRPLNMFVAGFIGSPSMNFVHGKIEENDGSLRFIGEHVNVAINEGKAKTIRERGYVGKETVLGIRPEDLHDEEIFLQSSLNTHISAFIEVTEHLGHESILHLKIGEANATTRLDSRGDYKVGADIKLAIDMNKAHFFDKGTTENILL